MSRHCANNQELLILAALASIRISRGLDQNQIATLAAFFEVLGDNLALLTAPPCSGIQKEREPGS